MTREGYLDVRARISRAGVYEYAAYELAPLFDDREPLDLIRVYRSADEVFKSAAMQSFAKKPVTIGHPWTNVTAENVKDHQAGFSGDTIGREGDYLTCSLLIQSADAVNRILRGDGELSAGYECDLTREIGTHEGVRFDAVQRNIIGNHIALVDAGRCGPLCRVGDRAPSGAKPQVASVAHDCACNGKPDMTTATAVAAALMAVTHDGFTGQMDAVAATMFGKVKDQAAALQTANTKLEAELSATKTSMADAATKHAAELETLRKQIPDGAMLDLLVAGREKVKTDAKKVMGDAFAATGTDAEIRRAVVNAKMGDKAKDKPDEYVSIAFTTLVDLAGDGNTNGNGQNFTGRDTISEAAQAAGGQAKPGTAASARQAMLDRMTNASQPAKA